LAASKLASVGISKATASPSRSFKQPAAEEVAPPKPPAAGAEDKQPAKIQKTVSFGANNEEINVSIRESNSSAGSTGSTQTAATEDTVSDLASVNSGKPELPPKPDKTEAPGLTAAELGATSIADSSADRTISTDSEATGGSDVSPRKKMSIMASATEQMGSFMKAGTRRLRRNPPSASGSKLGGKKANASSAGRRGSITRLGLQEAGAQFYTMAQLTSGAVESQIDPTRRELYLSNEDFMTYFKITKDEFLQQPKWKQVSQKKKFRLF